MIFMHGLGDSGHGWSQVGQMFSRDRLPHFKFIYPHAPAQPVTVNGGQVMPSWYDIHSLGLDLTRPRVEDDEGLEKSSQRLMQLVQQEISAGIPAERIVIGGFSQGGAVTYYSLLKSGHRFGGAAVLSSYLPVQSKAKQYNTGRNASTPVFVSHGTDDGVIPCEFGELSAKLLQSELGFKNLSFNRYAGMDHGACDKLLDDLQAFLVEHFPAN
jgi:predicted esterase